MERIIAYTALGLAIGVLSGLFGVGGSSIATPILRVALGVPALIALATPLPVTIPTAISGGIAYYRRGLADLPIAFWCILGGIPGVIAGALATAYISGFWLMILTGIFVMGLGLRLAWHAQGNSETTKEAMIAQHAHRQCDKGQCMLIGLVAGVFSGLLAIGGGIMLVPAFIIILGMSMQEAAATSLICVAGLAIPGTIVHWMLGHIDPIIMLSLGVAVIPASYVGARIAMRLKSAHLQLLFGLFLVLFSWYFLYSEIAGTIGSQ